MVKRSDAVHGIFLPLQPAGQRRLGLEDEVPALGVLLANLMEFQFHVSVDMVVVHGAKQALAYQLCSHERVHLRCDRGRQIST